MTTQCLLSLLLLSLPFVSKNSNEQGKIKEKKTTNAYVCLSQSSGVFLLCEEYQERLPAVHVFRQQFVLSTDCLGITAMQF